MPLPYPIPQPPKPPTPPPPGPYDPPGGGQRRRVAPLPQHRRVPNRLAASVLYPGMLSWWPGETSRHGTNPVLPVVFR